jgi:hippurate hydrolase
VEASLRRVCEGVASAFGVRVGIEYRRGYPPTINSAAEAALCAEAALALVGEENVTTDGRPSMGAEDFAYYLQKKPGCYVWIGNGAGEGEGGCMLHNPHYDFNDEILPSGVAYWVELVHRALAPEAVR